MKIIISENQMRRLTKTFSKPTIVEEKLKTVVGKEIVTGPMTNALNKLIKKKQGELLKDWKYYLSAEGDAKFLQLANKETGEYFKKRRFYSTQGGRMAVTAPVTIPVTVGGQGLFEELNKNEDFNYFFTRNIEAANQLKEQIQKMKLKVQVYQTDGPGEIEIFVVKNTRKNRKGEKIYTLGDGVPVSNLLPLGNIKDGAGANRAGVIAGDSLVQIFSGSIGADLGWLQLKAPIIETEGPEDSGTVAKEYNYKFQVQDPFEFDSAEITDEAEGSITTEMNRLKKELKDDGVYENYLQEKINGKNIIVQAFSSIDAKSDEIGGGAVTACNPRRVTRAKYNLCLSQKRAETIVNYLNSTYKDIFGKAKLIAKGMGELESENSVNLPYSDPKQKAHRDSKRVSTKADRKFVINLPVFKTTKIVKK
tara:strand:- start:15213 stop:16475 length:1263 start_codon:yes stop_codon:yes gene_type:complete